MTSVETLRDQYQDCITQCGRRHTEEVQSKISQLLSTFVTHHLSEGDTYEEKIRAIFEAFDHRVHPNYLTEVIGCSESYVRRFSYNPDTGQAFEKEWSKQTQDEKVSPGQRTRIIRRDNGQCRRCQADDSLEVHHIIPVRREGTKEDSNLVTLCEDCHTAAHNGSKTTSDTVYDDHATFEDWISTDPHPAETTTGQSSLVDFN